MKNLLFLLAIAMALLRISSTLALNCTMYYGDYNTLCNTVDTLSISEDEKYQLMQPNAYGNVVEENATANLSLVKSNEPIITLESIYQEKIVILGKLIIFIFVNYSIFSSLTKHGAILRWLTAVS